MLCGAYYTIFAAFPGIVNEAAQHHELAFSIDLSEATPEMPHGDGEIVLEARDKGALLRISFN